MGCYTAPLAAAIAHYGLRNKIKNWKNSRQHKQLNLLLAGGSVFGVVDHLINGELLAFSTRDMLLGVLITGSLILFWAVMVSLDKSGAPAESTA